MKDMKELLALLPETRRKLLLFLCEHRDEDRLRTFRQISLQTQLTPITVRNAMFEFEAFGFVKVYEVGRAYVVVPTEKLKEVCEMLSR